MNCQQRVIKEACSVFILPRIYAIYIYNTLQRRHYLAIVTAIIQGCILEGSALRNEFTELALTVGSIK